MRREKLSPILSPLCPQTETLWAPSPHCLRACPLATTTHQRTATSPGITTCLQFGTPHHPRSGARTAEESWHAGTHIGTPLLRLETEPAGCTLPGAGRGPTDRELADC